MRSSIDCANLAIPRYNEIIEVNIANETKPTALPC